MGIVENNSGCQAMMILHLWIDLGRSNLRTKNATVACVAPVAAKEGRLIYTMGVVSSLATLH